jgi:hypothetical protein
MNKNLKLIGMTIFLATILLGCAPVRPANYPVQSTSIIQDILLLEAWTQLYDRQEKVQLWDGRSISGHDLAQFVLDNAIPVVWDTEGVCGRSSCSVHYFDGETWGFEDGQAGVDPIYISPLLKDMPASRLENAVAHEIFHRTKPFGAVRDTQFEEFTAYYVGDQITHTTGERLTRTNGLDAVSLKQWFIDHDLTEYLDLDPYPLGMAALVDNSSQTSVADDNSAGQIASQGNLASQSTADATSTGQIISEVSQYCQINLEGWIECK